MHQKLCRAGRKREHTGLLYNFVSGNLEKYVRLTNESMSSTTTSRIRFFCLIFYRNSSSYKRRCQLRGGGVFDSKSDISHIQEKHLRPKRNNGEKSTAIATIILKVEQ